MVGCPIAIGSVEKQCIMVKVLGRGSHSFHGGWEAKRGEEEMWDHYPL
jgi:hypothetical protein